MFGLAGHITVDLLGFPTDCLRFRHWLAEFFHSVILFSLAFGAKAGSEIFRQGPAIEEETDFLVGLPGNITSVLLAILLVGLVQRWASSCL